VGTDPEGSALHHSQEALNQSAKNDPPREPEWLRGYQVLELFCGTRDYRLPGIGETPPGAAGWRQLILKKKSSGPSVGTPSKRSLQLYFKVWYDLDTFRRFVTRR
jgi:hypothetical protein